MALAEHNVSIIEDDGQLFRSKRMINERQVLKRDKELIKVQRVKSHVTVFRNANFSNLQIVTYSDYSFLKHTLHWLAGKLHIFSSLRKKRNTCNFLGSHDTEKDYMKVNKLRISRN